MIVFISFLLGIVVGFIIIRAIIVYRMKRMLDSIANEPMPKQEKKIINIDLVKMHHAIFAYDRDTQMFLAQGATKQEIVDNLQSRFPGQVFMANPKNIEEVGL